MSFDRVRRALAGLFAVAGLAFAAPTLAQSPEMEAQGTEVAREILTAANFKGTFVEKFVTPEYRDALVGLNLRPGTEDLLRAALAEQIEQDMPKLERAAGHEFAVRFTLEDLKTINAFLDGPTGRSLLGYVADGVAGRRPTPPSPELLAEGKRFEATPTGAAFFEEMRDLEEILRPLEAVLIEMVPGVIQRYEAKIAKAGE